MKFSSIPCCRFVLNSSVAILMAIFPLCGLAQVNVPSSGRDGHFRPTQHTVIDMSDRPDGIYEYTSVEIPPNIIVSFSPNAQNTPVVWLVSGDCDIHGNLHLEGVGASIHETSGAPGGPGAFRGGHAGPSPRDGLGPGGGSTIDPLKYSGNASFGSRGAQAEGFQNPPGSIYGNLYLLPLIGGSGGGGPGGGGGGAILIAASGTIRINGVIGCNGGYSSGKSTRGTAENPQYLAGGAGSGGAIRLVASRVEGRGTLNCIGGISGNNNYAGNGRIRIDALEDTFSGTIEGVVSRGFQPIILPPAGQNLSIAIQSVGATQAKANPTGSLTRPDVVISANQENPVPIVISCRNVPLNSEITVEIKPSNGSTIRATALNNQGTFASSTAAVSVDLPRGGGTIQAKAIAGIAGVPEANRNNSRQFRSYAQTGLTSEGERFVKIEVNLLPDGRQELRYVNESGKRLVAPTD